MKPLRRWLPLAVLLVLVAGCARVQPHIALPALGLAEPSFFPTLESYSGAPIVAGNSVEILLNGENIFPAMVEAIRSARHSITYAQYYYAEGPVSRDIAEALAERCRAGVGVSVLLDSFGALLIPPEYVEHMTVSGCHVAWFRPISQSVFRGANNRNHRRILVIDGRVGITGGSGVSRKWMGNGRVENHWRDTDVRIEGPVIEYMQGAFAENWLETTGIVLGGEAYFPRPSRPVGRIYAQIVRSSPAGGASAMYTTFLLALAAARQSIMVTNPYFILDDKMTEAVTEAARRGVRVMVLVPGAIDHNLVRQASRRKFGHLLRSGIEIYEYRAGLLHAKTMVIDGVWSTIGSANLDNRSFALNEELNAMFYSAEVARQMEEIFAEDLKYSARVDYRDWSTRSIGSRILEVLAYPFGDLL